MGCSLVLTVCRQVKVLGFRVSQTDTRSSWRRVNLVNQQTRSGCLYAVFQPNGCIQKTKNKHRQLRLNIAISKEIHEIIPEIPDIPHIAVCDSPVWRRIG